MVRVESLCTRLPSEKKYTLMEQEMACHYTSESHGWSVTGVIKECAKPTTPMADRPAIQDLLNDLRDDSFDILMINDIRRIIGSDADINALMRLLKQHRKSLYIIELHNVFPADALDNKVLLDALHGRIF